jgi:hypothetical protein
MHVGTDILTLSETSFPACLGGRSNSQRQGRTALIRQKMSKSLLRKNNGRQGCTDLVDTLNSGVCGGADALIYGFVSNVASIL